MVLVKRAICFIAILLMVGTVLTNHSSLASIAQEPTVGEPADHVSYGESQTPPELFMAEYLKIAETIIFSAGNIVTIEGSTETYQNVDQISLELYIQYWNSSDDEWEDLAYAGEYNATNNNYVEGYRSYEVESGFYYRTKGIHSATVGSLTESVNTYSGSLALHKRF